MTRALTNPYVAVTVVFADGTSRARVFSGIAQESTAKIVIDGAGCSAVEAEDVFDGVCHDLIELGGSVATSSSESISVEEAADSSDIGEANILIALPVSKGSRAKMNRALEKVRQMEDKGVIAPILNSDARPEEHLEDGLEELNALRWSTSPAEVASDLLALVRLTSLDRRVFISYRQRDTMALADQLHVELTKRNFQVFLDRTSVPPASRFQERLMESLADKAMVLLLDSDDYQNSQWTIAELNFARAHHLGMLVLRLPDVSPGIPILDKSELKQLETGDLVVDEKGEILTNAALKEVMDLVLQEHGRAIVHRRRRYREEMVAALKANSVADVRFDEHGLLRIADGDGAPCCVVRIATRPPGAEDFEYGDRRREGLPAYVVGPVGAMARSRRSTLDWMSEKSTLKYVDLEEIPELAFDISRRIP